jgi:hypothetical protein
VTDHEREAQDHQVRMTPNGLAVPMTCEAACARFVDMSLCASLRAPTTYDARALMPFLVGVALPFSFQTPCHIAAYWANTMEFSDLRVFIGLRMSFELCRKLNRIQGPDCLESGHMASGFRLQARAGTPDPGPWTPNPGPWTREKPISR